MEVLFQDLTVTTERIHKQFLKAVDSWLLEKHFILDRNVEKFEENWSSFCDTKYCVGTSSGSDALYLALLAMGIGRGDEVIVQGNAYNASVVAILRVGAIPKFVDITKNFLVNILNIKGKINTKTKAIMVVHLYGNVYPIEELREYNLPIIEDCAQAHGYKPKGDIAAWSFYPTKTLGGFGDAGAVTTNNPEWNTKMRAMRNLGQIGKNSHFYFGSTMRLDPIQAIALNLQLSYLQEDIQKRRQLKNYYDEAWGPYFSGECYPHLYPIIHENRDKWRKKVLQDGIHTEVHYPVPVYRQPFYSLAVGYALPVTEAVCDMIVSLPFHLSLTREEQDYVIERVGKR